MYRRLQVYQLNFCHELSIWLLSLYRLPFWLLNFTFCFHFLFSDFKFIILTGFGHSAEMYHDTALQEAVFRGLKCHSNELSRTTKFVRLIAKYLHEEYNGVFYGKAQNLGRVLCKAYDKVLETYDVLILPTIPKKAPVFPKENPSLKGKTYN